MVKHTQVIRRQQPTNCLIVSHHFMGLVFLKGDQWQKIGLRLNTEADKIIVSNENKRFLAIINYWKNNCSMSTI